MSCTYFYPPRHENLHGLTSVAGGWMAMKRECRGVRPCWTSTRTLSRKKGREHRDLRALLASNSKRARTTCLEYSFVIFPSGHPPFLCSFISSLLSAWLLSDILFAKSLPAGCHCFLSYMRRNVSSLLVWRFHAIEPWQHEKKE